MKPKPTSTPFPLLPAHPHESVVIRFRTLGVNEQKPDWMKLVTNGKRFATSEVQLILSDQNLQEIHSEGWHNNYIQYNCKIVYFHHFHVSWLWITSVGLDDLFVHYNSFHVLSLVQKLQMSKGKQSVPGQNNSNTEEIGYTALFRTCSQWLCSNIIQ